MMSRNFVIISASALLALGAEIFFIQFDFYAYKMSSECSPEEPELASAERAGIC
jgi:hypothetical protein